MTAYYWIQAIVCAAVIIDMYRRPESAWAAADRQRFWWAGIVGAMGLFGLGPLALLAYAVLVLPGLVTDDPFPVSPGFRKY